MPTTVLPRLPRLTGRQKKTPPVARQGSNRTEGPDYFFLATFFFAGFLAFFAAFFLVLAAFFFAVFFFAAISHSFD